MNKRIKVNVRKSNHLTQISPCTSKFFYNHFTLKLQKKLKNITKGTRKGSKIQEREKMKMNLKLTNTYN